MKRNRNFITTPKAETHENRRSTESVTIIIFGENHGYRMKAYGAVPLIPINAKTLLEHQINAVKSIFLNFEIILCAGYEVQKIVNFVKHKFYDINIRVVENQVHFNSNCCESARLCINNTVNRKIILCGGGVLLHSDQLGMMSTEDSMILTQLQNDNLNFEVGTIENNGVLEGLSLGIKPDYWTEMISLTNPRIIGQFYNIVSNPEFKNKYMFEAVNELAKKSEILVKKNDKHAIIKVDNIKTLKKIAN